MAEQLKLLKLPTDGCLRVIDKTTQEWHEFALADILVVVLPGHPVSLSGSHG